IADVLRGDRLVRREPAAVLVQRRDQTAEGRAGDDDRHDESTDPLVPAPTVTTLQDALEGQPRTAIPLTRTLEHPRELAQRSNDSFRAACPRATGVRTVPARSPSRAAASSDRYPSRSTSTTAARCRGLSGAIARIAASISSIRSSSSSGGMIRVERLAAIAALRCAFRNVFIAVT